MTKNIKIKPAVYPTQSDKAVQIEKIVYNKNSVSLQHG